MANPYENAFAEYFRLEKMICAIESESVEARREVLEANYRDVKKHLSEEKARAVQLEGQLKKEKKKEKKLHRPGLTRFKARIGSEGLEKEKEMASDRVSEIVAEGAGVDETLSVLKDQAASLRMEIKQLSSRGEELNSLKAVQEEILVSVFSGAAGDAEENAIEKQVDALSHKKEKVSFAKTKYESAETHLKAAERQVTRGLEILHFAMGCNTVDIIGNRPGLGRGHTPLMNMAQANQMQQCKQVTPSPSPPSSQPHPFGGDSMLIFAVILSLLLSPSLFPSLSLILLVVFGGGAVEFGPSEEVRPLSPSHHGGDHPGDERVGDAAVRQHLHGPLPAPEDHAQHAAALRHSRVRPLRRTMDR
jgi:hypothetical protein